MDVVVTEDGGSEIDHHGRFKGKPFRAGNSSEKSVNQEWYQASS
jgi:hypothetical protein